MVDYVSYDYEMPEPKGSKANFWHIYTIDAEPTGVEFGHSTILTLTGPDTEQLEKAIVAICDTINSTIDLAEKLKSEE